MMGLLKSSSKKPSQIFDYLCLVGDTSDNIPGVPKKGWAKNSSDIIREIPMLR